MNGWIVARFSARSGLDEALRGVAARSAEAGEPGPGEPIVEVELDRIRPSRYQARTEIGEAEIDALAEVMRAQGLTHPVTLRAHEEGGYELVAGERRWRAARRLGWSRIGARVRSLTHLEAHLIGISENRRRADLTSWERAREAAGLRDHLRAEARGATVRQLAELLREPLGTVSEQLTIADALDSALREATGATESELRRLPHTALLGVAKRPAELRAEALEAALARIRGTKRPARRRADPHEDRWTRYWTRGGFQVNIRTAIGTMEPERATGYLEALVPGVAALSARTADGEEPVPVRVEADYGALLFLPSRDGLSPERRREAAALLRAEAERLESEDEDET